VNLTKKDVDFCWKEDHELSFQQLKLALITPPVLKYPDFKRPFILVTDASNVSLGAILAQKYDIEHPVWYASRCLKGAEKNYSTIEKECLAVVWAINYFKIYLIGVHFTIYTDHRPLKYLLSMKNPSSRLARWAMSLTDYRFTIEYRPGKHNHVDSLTRLDYPLDPVTVENEEEEEESSCLVRTLRHINDNCTPILYDLDRLKELQSEDKDTQKLITIEGFYK
ncbi:ribonuclease H family protein, partial [Enterobacter cloacae complex sp. 2DZ2F20B]|uniref:Ty3/Gypsy family RNase HI domain-containing protein n=1 Tax=Enterobacter cloacae complex sp. 2DZ2F20B TaxID=2511993 RepID=UPI0013EA4130